MAGDAHQGIAVFAAPVTRGGAMPCLTFTFSCFVGSSVGGICPGVAEVWAISLNHPSTCCGQTGKSPEVPQMQCDAGVLGRADPPKFSFPRMPPSISILASILAIILPVAVEGTSLKTPTRNLSGNAHLPRLFPFSGCYEF